MPRLFTDNHLVIASHNPGKIREISSMLQTYGLNLFDASSLNLPEPEETGSTYLENALKKASVAVELTKMPAISDDSGIEVDALLGSPGLDTAPYTKELGGLDNVFALWAAHEGIKKNPKASFVCLQVLMWPDGHYEYFMAKVDGQLKFPARGGGGHGYDPVFMPDGHNCTMAEMPLQEKNRYSHRFLALQGLLEACLKYPPTSSAS
jgi:XTP/dITP diphosphohydrolase